MGNQYTGIFFVSISNDYRGGPSGEIIGSIPVCNNRPAVQSFCWQLGSPWVGFISNVTQKIAIPMYPSFGLALPGEMKVLIEDYNITFEGSEIPSRDINGYVPISVSQNTIRRKINILVVNDGSFDEVEMYAFNGFDLAQQTGVVPESIMVGIPQTGKYCNRQYELSFEACKTGWSKYNRNSNPLTTSNYYGCPGNEDCNLTTGGNDAYLTWIYQDVIPAVLDTLNMDLGEVSIVGGSMGGLTACYAPSKFPQWYSRGFCYAPAVMWNYGSLADTILSNFESHKMLPKSIVMEVGHETYDVFRDDVTMETKNMIEIQMDVMNAWKSIGMETMKFSSVVFPPSGDNSQTATILGGAPQHMAMFYNQRAAFHAPSNWQVSFYTHLVTLYRPSFNDSTRMQRSDYDWYLGQTTTETTDEASTTDDNTKEAAYLTVIIVLAAALGVVLVIGVYFGYTMFGRSDQKDRFLKSTDRL